MRREGSRRWGRLTWLPWKLPRSEEIADVSDEKEALERSVVHALKVFLHARDL